MPGGVAKGELAVGIAADLELTLMHAAMMRRADGEAIFSRMFAAFGLSNQVVDVDVAPPVTAGHSAAAAIAQQYGAPDGGG
jgi:hypothetical protein